MSALDLARFQGVAAIRRTSFAGAVPFPHVVIDDFLDPSVASAVLHEFALLPESEGWTYWYHLNQKKRGFADVTRMGDASRRVIAALQSDVFVRALELLTGIDGLLADPELDGGGLHEMPSAGFLNVHADFLSHIRNTHWSRQLNLLVFLNREWDESHKGWLELWDGEVQRPVQRIAPIFNRCVIFRTGKRCFHGVPDGVAFPNGGVRRSLALYYFRDEGRTCKLKPTRYVPRPRDSSVQRALIRLDDWALHAYTALKRYTPLGDRLVSKLLRHL